MCKKGYQINQLAVSFVTHTELSNHFLPQDFWICKACKKTEKILSLSEVCDIQCISQDIQNWEAKKNGHIIKYEHGMSRSKSHYPNVVEY